MQRIESQGGINHEGEQNIQETVNLREDIKPIEKVVVDFKFENAELVSIQDSMEDDEELIHSVDFDGGDLETLQAAGFKHDGPDSYLISPISERNWTSDHYFNCTAAVGIGKDLQTGKEISFLTHQDPNYFVDGGEEKLAKFSKVLSDTLSELKTFSAEGTVEVLLLGGNYEPAKADGDHQPEQYIQSIINLREIIHNSLGFDPKVLVGPNNRVGSETVVVVETQKRKVWVQRDKQSDVYNESFQANQLEEVKQTWIDTK